MTSPSPSPSSTFNVSRIGTYCATFDESISTTLSGYYFLKYVATKRLNSYIFSTGKTPVSCEIGDELYLFVNENGIDVMVAPRIDETNLKKYTFILAQRSDMLPRVSVNDSTMIMNSKFFNILWNVFFDGNDGASPPTVIAVNQLPVTNERLVQLVTDGNILSGVIPVSSNDPSVVFMPVVDAPSLLQTATVNTFFVNSSDYETTTGRQSLRFALYNGNSWDIKDLYAPDISSTNILNGGTHDFRVCLLNSGGTTINTGSGVVSTNAVLQNKRFIVYASTPKGSVNFIEFSSITPDAFSSTLTYGTNSFAGVKVSINGTQYTAVEQNVVSDVLTLGDSKTMLLKFEGEYIGWECKYGITTSCGLNTAYGDYNNNASNVLVLRNYFAFKDTRSCQFTMTSLKPNSSNEIEYLWSVIEGVYVTVVDNNLAFVSGSQINSDSRGWVMTESGGGSNGITIRWGPSSNRFLKVNTPSSKSGTNPSTVSLDNTGDVFNCVYCTLSTDGTGRCIPTV